MEYKKNNGEERRSIRTRQRLGGGPLNSKPEFSRSTPRAHGYMCTDAGTEEGKTPVNFDENLK